MHTCKSSHVCVRAIRYQSPSHLGRPILDIIDGNSSCRAVRRPSNTNLLTLAFIAGDEGQESSRQRQALARLLAARGRTTEALAALEPLLLAHPAHADLLCLRGNCLAAAGNNVGVRCMLHAAMW